MSIRVTALNTSEMRILESPYECDIELPSSIIHRVSTDSVCVFHRSLSMFYPVLSSEETSGFY